MFIVKQPHLPGEHTGLVREVNVPFCHNLTCNPLITSWAPYQLSWLGLYDLVLVKLHKFIHDCTHLGPWYFYSNWKNIFQSVLGVGFQFSPYVQVKCAFLMSIEMDSCKQSGTWKCYIPEDGLHYLDHVYSAFLDNQMSNKKIFLVVK